MEKKWWVDFGASIKIVAENSEEAKKIFWALMDKKFEDLDYVEIDCVERIEGRRLP